ncbi:MAG: hypothetical protein AAB922_03190 [Patescibacteria group bacterium]
MTNTLDIPESENLEVDITTEKEVDWEAKAKAHYAQLKEVKAKAEKAEAELLKFREKDQKQEVPAVLDWKKAFSLKNEGYSEQEILALGEMAESAKMPVEKLLENSIIKSGIEAARSKAKETAAVPTPSNRSTMIEGKTIGELVKDKESFKTNFDKIMEKYKG